MRFLARNDITARQSRARHPRTTGGSVPQPLRSALPVLGAAALLAGTVLAAPSVAAEPASLSITSVAPVNDSGGLSGWLPIACSVRVELADPTPADPSRFVLELSHPDGS